MTHLKLEKQVRQQNRQVANQGSSLATSSKSSLAQTQSSSSNSSLQQQSWTLESAKDYYLATVRGNAGNPNQLLGDIPTQAQQGPTNWQVMSTSNNGQIMTIGINGGTLFTITNNGDGTATINLESITLKVRNSDHYIPENNQPR